MLSWPEFRFRLNHLEGAREGREGIRRVHLRQLRRGDKRLRKGKGMRDEEVKA